MPLVSSNPNGPNRGTPGYGGMGPGAGLSAGGSGGSIAASGTGGAGVGMNSGGWNRASSGSGVGTSSYGGTPSRTSEGGYGSQYNNGGGGSYGGGNQSGGTGARGPLGPQGEARSGFANLGGYHDPHQTAGGWGGGYGPQAGQGIMGSKGGFSPSGTKQDYAGGMSPGGIMGQISGPGSIMSKPSPGSQMAMGIQPSQTGQTVAMNNLGAPVQAPDPYGMGSTPFQNVASSFPSFGDYPGMSPTKAQGQLAQDPNATQNPYQGRIASALGARNPSVIGQQGTAVAANVARNPYDTAYSPERVIASEGLPGQRPGPRALGADQYAGNGMISPASATGTGGVTGSMMSASGSLSAPSQVAQAPGMPQNIDPRAGMPTDITNNATAQPPGFMGRINQIAASLSDYPMTPSRGYQNDRNYYDVAARREAQRKKAMALAAARNAKPRPSSVNDWSVTLTPNSIV